LGIRLCSKTKKVTWAIAGQSKYWVIGRKKGKGIGQRQHFDEAYALPCLLYVRWVSGSGAEVAKLKKGAALPSGR